MARLHRDHLRQRQLPLDGDARLNAAYSLLAFRLGFERNSSAFSASTDFR